MCSAHHERPDGVADRFQRIGDPVVASRLELRAVLKSNPTWAALVDDSDGVEEQVVGFKATTSALRVDAGELDAGRASGDHVGKSSCVSQHLGAGEAPEIVIELHPWKVRGEHVAPPIDGFACRHSRHPGAMETEAPAARGAGAEVQHPHDPTTRYPNPSAALIAAVMDLRTSRRYPSVTSAHAGKLGVRVAS
jgi:hypothetical protein